MTTVLNEGIPRQGTLLDSPTEGLHRPVLTWDEQDRLFPDTLGPETAFGPGDAHGAIESHEEFPVLSGNS